jgi:hypothetical protein
LTAWWPVYGRPSDDDHFAPKLVGSLKLTPSSDPRFYSPYQESLYGGGAEWAGRFDKVTAGALDAGIGAVDTQMDKGGTSFRSTAYWAHGYVTFDLGRDLTLKAELAYNHSERPGATEVAYRASTATLTLTKRLSDGANP